MLIKDPRLKGVATTLTWLAPARRHNAARQARLRGRAIPRPLVRLSNTLRRRRRLPYASDRLGLLLAKDLLHTATTKGGNSVAALNDLLQIAPLVGQVLRQTPAAA